jgi:apolipoprotein N-acyltransferase
MTENTEAKKSIHARHELPWCASGRNSGIFWGILLVTIGLIWIGKKTGFIPMDMALFCPSIMVMIGVWILAGALIRRVRSS